ncbi:MAG: divalent-cation tolerance protein CutA [Verrucomicrobiota bacterium]
MKVAILLTTVNSKSTAVRLARAALNAKAAACIQILPAMESHYVWKGKRKKAREFLVLAKTSTRKASTLEKLWSRLHPYDCPELITLSGRAATSYARWVQASI